MAFPVSSGVSLSEFFHRTFTRTAILVRCYIFQPVSGKKWSQFASRKVREWTSTYRSVLDSGLPLLIIGYEELEDSSQLRTQLLRISNYLHVPIRSSVLDCVIERSHEFWVRPKPLRQGFQPFNLLRLEDYKQYQRTEWDIQMLVRLRRDRYRPKVR